MEKPQLMHHVQICGQVSKYPMCCGEDHFVNYMHIATSDPLACFTIKLHIKYAPYYFTNFKILKH